MIPKANKQRLGFSLNSVRANKPFKKGWDFLCIIRVRSVIMLPL